MSHGASLRVSKFVFWHICSHHLEQNLAVGDVLQLFIERRDNHSGHWLAWIAGSDGWVGYEIYIKGEDHVLSWYSSAISLEHSELGEAIGLDGAGDFDHLSLDSLNCAFISEEIHSGAEIIFKEVPAVSFFKRHDCELVS